MMLAMICCWPLSAVLLAAGAAAGGRTHAAGGPARDVERTPGDVSIVDTLAPGELRGHGAEDLTGWGGVTVQSVGQASDAQPGAATYALWEVAIGAAHIGTGFAERFLFSEPLPKPTAPAPLLVVHHRFGKTHLDLAVATDYLEQAAARGWYVLGMLSGSNKHFLSDVAHAHTEFVLDWTLNSNPGIDPQRIYGVGFSMGGGMALNYAARHLDPTRPMFAALVNHTGNVSLAHVLAHEVLEVQQILGFWFGTLHPLDVDPLRLQRASLIDYDPLSGQFLKSGDMIRNLAATPLYMTRASNDTIVVAGVPYLKIQNDVLDRHIEIELGIAPGPTYQYEVVPYVGHSWDMLPESTVLDFFEPFALQMPSSGRVLADRNARWYHFTTALLAPELANGEFAWTVDTSANSVALTEVAGLAALTIDTLQAGLDPTAALTLAVTSKDAEGVQLLVKDIGSPPSLVTVDGEAASWFMIEQTLALPALADAMPHTFVVIP